MTSSASNNSPDASNKGEQDSSADKASGQAQNRPVQKVAFRRDVIFENVCCMPSSLSASKPSRLLQRSGRKAPGGSSMDDAPDDKSSRTSGNHKTCGKGFCFKDDSIHGEGEEEDDEEYLKATESSGILRLEKNAPSSTEPRGDGLTNLLTSSGGRLPSDVINRSNAEAATAVSTVDSQVDSNISRIKRPSRDFVGADVNVAAGNDGHGRENHDDGDDGGLLLAEMQKEHLASEHSSPPPSSLTGEGTVEGNLRAPVAASNEFPLGDASSSDAEHYPNPQQQQQQQVRSSGEILWEFSGRRLSNFCRNLMTESVVGPLDGETDSIHSTAGTVAAANEARIEDERSSSSSEGGGGYSTEKSNHREFSTADAAPAGGCPFSSDCKAADPTPAPADRSGCTGASDTAPIKRETANDFAVSSFTDKTASDAFNSSGRPPIRFLSDSPHRNNRPIISETKKKSGTIDTRLDVGANLVEFASVDDKQNLSAAAAIAADLCEENSSPGKLRNDSSSSGAVKWTGRRGRALERESYDASLLLKDFIRPDQKKFSVAPSLPSSSADFNIDTELAIWEPADYAPSDRHKSVPPAAEVSLKLARNEEAAASSSLLLRSRQKSVSPQRQRIAGRRRSKDSKSVEFIGSWQRSSPVGAKLGRRTLSKEWQILTLTTTEEITTLTRPSTRDDPLEPGRQESDNTSSKILPTEEEEVSNKDSTPPIEVDELVKALLDLVSENQDETLKQKSSHSHDESSSDLSKLSAEEFLDFSNNNVLPTSWRHSPIQRSNEGDQFNSNSNRLHIEADSSISRNESEKNRSEELSPELTEYKHKSGLDGNAFDEDDDSYDALVYDDLTLHITEESDDHLSPSSFRETESVEHIPTEQIDGRVGRPEDAAAAAAAAAASSEGGSCRQRVVSKKDDAADSTTSANRRRSDGSEVLPEKAFLESVFSSLGTIIFLLLAALIFHLLNSFVDHEL